MSGTNLNNLEVKSDRNFPWPYSYTLIFIWQTTHTIDSMYCYKSAGRNAANEPYLLSDLFESLQITLTLYYDINLT